MIKVLLILGIGSNELLSKFRTVLKLYAMNIIPITTDMLENKLFNKDTFGTHRN
jgi:hypothetical protein